MRENSLKIEDVEKVINIPVEEWREKCHEIASLLLRKNVVSGMLRYGHWIGPIHSNSTFADRRGLGFTHHGWIEQSDGTIIDPTRFEFEQVSPYIYVGLNDYYDAGGNQFRELMMREPPVFNEEEKLIRLKDTGAKMSVFVKGNLDCRSTKTEIIITLKQAFWLANLPLQILNEAAKTVFESLIDAGLIALIPYDNKQLVLGNDV